MPTPAITDYLTPESQNESGSVTMLAHGPEDRKVLYLSNQHGHKLLKIAVKSEPGSHQNKLHAQIKGIPYGIKRAIVWHDLPSDPKLVALHDGVDLTYHGGQNNDQTPKVHIKATSGDATLIDDSLSLAYRNHHMGDQMPDPVLLKQNIAGANQAQTDWATGFVNLPDVGRVALHRQQLDEATGMGRYAFV
ncbi:MAG: hypothetical protein Q8O81_12340 [Giesbergeria sp.]|nr:hypothetical protein [Giesbergeria sp.]